MALSIKRTMRFSLISNSALIDIEFTCIKQG